MPLSLGQFIAIVVLGLLALLAPVLGLDPDIFTSDICEILNCAATA
jgi:hypothetical protein